MLFNLVGIVGCKHNLFVFLPTARRLLGVQQGLRFRGPCARSECQNGYDLRIRPHDAAGIPGVLQKLENGGYEIIDVCRAIKPNISVYRATFSEITTVAVRRALQQLGQPDKRQSDAVDVRMELELIAQQQEGNDTTAIQKRLEELQRNLGVGSAANNKSTHYAPASGAPGGGAGRKRPNLPEGPTRVDRRPKAIVVTGFAAEEADFVLGHFKVSLMPSSQNEIV